MEEYEIQHYGFSIAQLNQETADMVYDEVEKACATLVTSITTSPLIDTKVASEIERERNILANNIKVLFKDPLTQMKNYISENFSIPPNVTLSTDQKKLQCMDENEDELQETHDQLLKTFMMFEQLISTLNNELDTYKNMNCLLEMQTDALDVAELSLSMQHNLNYVKELYAEVKNTLSD